MSPENEQNLSKKGEQESRDGSAEALNTPESINQEKIDPKESLDTSDLSLVDVDTKPPFLNKDGREIIEIPKNVTIKSAIRKNTPKLLSDDLVQKIIKFTTADSGIKNDAARGASVYEAETETFWSDIFNASKSIN